MLPAACSCVQLHRTADSCLQLLIVAHACSQLCTAAYSLQLIPRTHSCFSCYQLRRVAYSC
eukprot:8315660-Alexandrium_andersonii.AAC.1